MVEEYFADHENMSQDHLWGIYKTLATSLEDARVMCNQYLLIKIVAEI